MKCQSQMTVGNPIYLALLDIFGVKSQGDRFSVIVDAYLKLVSFVLSLLKIGGEREREREGERERERKRERENNCYFF